MFGFYTLLVVPVFWILNWRWSIFEKSNENLFTVLSEALVTGLTCLAIFHSDLETRDSYFSAIDLSSLIMVLLVLPLLIHFYIHARMGPTDQTYKPKKRRKHYEP